MEIFVAHLRQLVNNHINYLVTSAEVMMEGDGHSVP